MTRTLLPTLTIIAVAAAAPALGQAAGPAVPVTLDEAIAQGLANSKRLAEIEARKDAAGFAVQGQAAADKPDVAFLAGYSRTNHVDPFVIPTTIGRPPQVVYPDIPDNYHSRADLQWPIFTAGRVDALERAARAEQNAVGEDLAAARSDLRLEITRAFWALVTARETESVLARSLDAINAQVKDLRSRFSSGFIPPNDVSSAEAQASRQQVLAIEAANARAIAEADLRRLTGIETAGTLEPRESLTVPPAAPVEPGAAAPRVEDLIATALKTRPERKALEQHAASAEDRAEASRAGGRPQVAVGAGYDYARPNPRIFPRSTDWKTSWDVSINLSWSLWDSGRRGAQQGEALATARSFHARVDDFDRQVTFEVRQRSLQLDSSRAAVTATEDEVRAAAEAERVVGERYRVGVATPTDVLDAQVARLQAELDRTRAIANVRLAEAQLQRALGR
jgi:outer membrane protein TolC